MCGIVGYIGGRDATEVLVEGLRRLEYRGYDSSGVALLSGGDVQIRRAVGKLRGLETLLQEKPVHGRVGLGHTRWATHGSPSEMNAHPHADHTGRIVVVHNGIIENYGMLKRRLEEVGVRFQSETDTEVVAHLISRRFHDLTQERGQADEKAAFVDAVRLSLQEVEGTFALGVVCSAFPELLIGARRDCPLVVGLGEGEFFLASDIPAILPHTRRVVFLEDRDLAVMDGTDLMILRESGEPIARAATTVLWDAVQAEKAGYKHFMLKEIHEQPRAAADTLMGRLNLQTGDVNLADAGFDESTLRGISRVRLVGCGTSWHAGLVGRFLLEKVAKIPCQTDIASELRYSDPLIDENDLIVPISQSGETADTLAATRLAKARGAKVLAIANAVGSSLTREAHGCLMTHCGPEIGVASTKAFTGQLVALLLLTLRLAAVRRSLPDEERRAMGGALGRLSTWLGAVLQTEEQMAGIARAYRDSAHFLFLGRHLNYPVALEGALKLKEISYIHAEGYPAGEMKHGPIALIEEGMPVVAVATRSRVSEKMASNIEEARSRGASVIAIATEGDDSLREKAAHVVYVPEVPEYISPILNVVPLQMLAYQMAVLRGCDVDQPRNLAKSVTVE